MENKPYFKSFIKYSVLNVLGMMGLSCYILADTFFVSKGLGPNGLAALNLAIPVYSFIHGSGLMLGMGGATKYSILKSQGKREEANRCFTNTLLLSVIFAIAFFLTGAFLSKTITAMLGADSHVFQMTHIYLKVLLLFAPAFLLNDVLICFVRNDDNPRLSMCGMLGGSFANILLDYLFIFPLNLGIFGAVLATGFAPVISMGFLSFHLIRRKNHFHLVASPHFGMTKSTLLLGFPSLIAEVSSGVVILVFNVIILRLTGNIGVAAYGVVANLSLVVTAIYTGIAQGIQPLISTAHGSHNKKGCTQILQYALFTVIFLSAVVYTSVFFLAVPITQVFNSENIQELQRIAEIGLKFYFTAAPFVGFNIILSMFFTSTERVLPAHIISLLRGLLLIVPMTFLLSSLWGMTGVWLAFPATEGLVATVLIVVFRPFSK